MPTNELQPFESAGGSVKRGLINKLPGTIFALTLIAGLVDLPAGPEQYPEKVTLVKERVLLGPRDGGPPPGDGFESAPIKEICDAIARELPAKEKKLP